MTTTSQNAAPTFRVRSRLGTVRDLAIVAVCAAIVGGFLAQVWSAPPPEHLRSAAEPASIHLAA